MHRRHALTVLTGLLSGSLVGARAVQVRPPPSYFQVRLVHVRGQQISPQNLRISLLELDEAGKPGVTRPAWYLPRGKAPQGGPPPLFGRGNSLLDIMDEDHFLVFRTRHLAVGQIPVSSDLIGKGVQTKRFEHSGVNKETGEKVNFAYEVGYEVMAPPGPSGLLRIRALQIVPPLGREDTVALVVDGRHYGRLRGDQVAQLPNQPGPTEVFAAGGIPTSRSVRLGFEVGISRFGDRPPDGPPLILGPTSLKVDTKANQVKKVTLKSPGARPVKTIELDYEFTP